MTMPSYLLTLSALCFLLASTASAAILRGTVHTSGVTPAAPSMNAYPGRAGSMAGMRMPPHGLASDAVLWLEHVPAAAESALAEHPQPRPKLAQRDQCFVPRVVVIHAGGAVDFPNMDPIYHNVFSVSPARRFDLGKYPRGQSRAIQFAKAGLVNVYCDIHSDMAAFILVVPTHAYLQPNADGEFAFPALPAGHYTLHVWHPDLPEVMREIELLDSGARDIEVHL